MTVPQRDYIKNLLAERAGLEEADEIRVELNAHREAGTLTKELGRKVIPRLLAIQPAPVPVGHYALELDGEIRFYLVTLEDTGRWAGRQFVRRVVGPDEFRMTGADSAQALNAIRADPWGAATLYGQEIGRCGQCGRRLTKKESREAGIGPICRRNLGR